MSCELRSFPLWLVDTGTTPSPVWAWCTVSFNAFEWLLPNSFGTFLAHINALLDTADLQNSLGAALSPQAPCKFYFPWSPWTQSFFCSIRGVRWVLPEFLPLPPLHCGLETLKAGSWGNCLAHVSPAPQGSLSFTACCPVSWKPLFWMFCPGSAGWFREEGKSSACYSSLARSWQLFFRFRVFGFDIPAF